MLSRQSISRVDAHVHLWDLERHPHAWIDPVTMPGLAQGHDLDDLAPLRVEDDVDQVVLVQSVAGLSHTEWLLARSAAPEVHGVVGWLPLDAPDLEEQLQVLRSGPCGHALVGVRHLVHEEDDPGWLARSSVLAGLQTLASHGLVYDLVLRAEQLPLATAVVADVPDGVFVLDHLGNPDLADRAARERWAEDLERLSALPNVRVKLSGLGHHLASRPSEVRDALSLALGLFGGERCMAGSDWPLVGLSSGAREWWRAVDDAVGAVPDVAPKDVLATTALSTYRPFAGTAS